MNYQKIYNQLIERGKVRNFTNRKVQYFEKHHIIPHCLGGSDDDSNLVNLTAREHFLAHWLLHRIYPDNYKLACAFLKCAFGHSKQRNFIPSSRSYEEAKLVLYQKNKIECTHCNKLLDIRNYHQFHGDNCKHNPNIDNLILVARIKQRKKQKKECEHCHKKVDYRNYKKWHGERCNDNQNPSEEVLEFKKQRNKKQSKLSMGRTTSKNKTIFIYDTSYNFIASKRTLYETAVFLNTNIARIYAIVHNIKVKKQNYILSYTEITNKQLKAA